MNRIASFFAGIPRALQRLFTGNSMRRIDVAFKQITDITATALDAIEQIAAMTPNRTDTEIITLAATFGISPVTPEMLHNKEDFLRMVARLIIQKTIGLSVKERILNTAIETAYVVYKASKPV